MRNFTEFILFSSRRRHTRFDCDWSSDVCSSDLDGSNRGTYERQQHEWPHGPQDRKSTRLNSSHSQISYAVFCLKKKKLIRCIVSSWKLIALFRIVTILIVIPNLTFMRITVLSY